MRVPSDVRLDRWTQDVADACEKLRYYAPETLLWAAEETASSHPDPEPGAEAYWIAAALRAAASTKASQYATAPLQEKPFVDTNSEAAWLVRVSKAYAVITPGDAQELLQQSAELSLEPDA